MNARGYSTCIQKARDVPSVSRPGLLLLYSFSQCLESTIWFSLVLPPRRRLSFCQSAALWNEEREGRIRCLPTPLAQIYVHVLYVRRTERASPWISGYLISAASAGARQGRTRSIAVVVRSSSRSLRRWSPWIAPSGMQLFPSLPPSLSLSCSFH